MKVSFAPDFIRSILDCEGYRDFIRLWIAERSKTRHFGFSDIARNGGFASRSFPRDVLYGTKRITIRSLSRFTKGMGLTGDLAAYFKLLVEIEEPACRPEGTEVWRLQRSRIALRSRLLERAGISMKTRLTEEIFLEEFPRIYAGLGAEERGASLKEISDRTRLPSVSLKKALAKFIENGWIRKEKDRYFPSCSHVNLEKLNQSVSFQRRFARTCFQAMKESEVQLHSQDKLFFSSTLSVRATNLPALKDELRNVLLRYVEKNEVAEGDRVVEIVTALI